MTKRAQFFLDQVNFGKILDLGLFKISLRGVFLFIAPAGPYPITLPNPAGQNLPNQKSIIYFYFQ